MNEKFFLSDETMEYEGKILHRIQAKCNIGGRVSTGDKGGWVQSASNLSDNGTCWIYDDAKVMDNAYVDKHASVYNEAVIFGNAVITDLSCVYNNSRIGGHTVLSYSSVAERDDNISDFKGNDTDRKLRIASVRKYMELCMSDSFNEYCSAMKNLDSADEIGCIYFGTRNSNDPKYEINGILAVDTSEKKTSLVLQLYSSYYSETERTYLMDDIIDVISFDTNEVFNDKSDFENKITEKAVNYIADNPYLYHLAVKKPYNDNNKIITAVNSYMTAELGEDFCISAVPDDGIINLAYQQDCRLEADGTVHSMDVKFDCYNLEYLRYADGIRVNNDFNPADRKDSIDDFIEELKIKDFDALINDCRRDGELYFSAECSHSKQETLESIIRSMPAERIAELHNDMVAYDESGDYDIIYNMSVLNDYFRNDTLSNILGMLKSGFNPKDDCFYTDGKNFVSGSYADAVKEKVDFNLLADYVNENHDMIDFCDYPVINKWINDNVNSENKNMKIKFVNSVSSGR